MLSDPDPPKAGPVRNLDVDGCYSKLHLIVRTSLLINAMLLFPRVIYEFIELSLRLFTFHNSIVRLNDLITQVVCDIQNDQNEVN